MQQELRRYRVIKAVGRGGFGTVYEADLLGAGGFRKRVALKVLNPDVADDTEFAQRLRDEARMLGLIDHPSVVRVDGLSLLGGRWTVVMEYVDGVDLKRLLAGGPVPAGPAVEIAEEVASALHAVYDAPRGADRPLYLLHRDIKPSNVQLTASGAVKVLDFGVARADFEQRESQTRSRFFGSANYMAPERLDAIDSHAGDVYALGAVLLELVTGAPVGRTSANRERHAACVNAGVALLRAQVGDGPLTSLVASCLAYDPALRPPARGVARQLREIRALMLGQPWLRDWAAEAIPPLTARHREVQDDLSGSIIEEGGGVLVEPSEGGVELHGAPARAVPGSVSSSSPISGSRSAGSVSFGAALPAGPDSGTFAHTAPANPQRVDAGRVLVLLLSATAGLVVMLSVGAVGLLFAQDELLMPEPGPLEVVVPVERSDIDALAEEPLVATPAPPTEPPIADAADASPTPAASPPAAAPPTQSRPPAPERASPRQDARPAVADEPEVEAPPSESDEPPPASGSAPTGQVLLASGDARVTLVGAAGTFPPGAMPAGRYTVQASFGGAAAVPAGQVEVVAGQTIRLSCRSALKRCIPR